MKTIYNKLWMLVHFNEKFDVFRNHYYLRYCKCCKHLTLDTHSSKISKEFLKQLNDSGKKEPEYIGDCRYTYVPLPRAIAMLIPYKLRIRFWVTGINLGKGIWD